MFSIFTLLLAFSNLPQTFSASAIAIDFGSEFITTSIIQSRKPLSLVENPQGTKINQYLYMNGNEKIFGSSAKVKAIKNPESVFHHLQEFLGKELNQEIKNYLRDFYQSYNIITDDKSGNMKFQLKYNDQKYLFTSTELMAIMLRYIKEFAEKYGKTDIDQCVISVPCFYGYKQHQAIKEAVELSGMKLMRIIHDNTAVAIKYFNEIRPQKENKYYIFYNMGASYTQVSLISIYSTYEGTRKDMKENQFIKIIDEKFDKNLGGRNFDYRLAKLIYKKYQQKTYNKLLTKEEINLIPMETITRLLPYAIKYKEMLSANKEIAIHVLGIEKNSEYEDILTRDEFLDECEDLLERLYSPLEKILTENDFKITQIMQVEFVGGGHRIPKIKEVIGKYIPQNKIGVHLNGDDVVAFGAGIYASNILGMLNSVKGVTKKVNLYQNGYVYDTKIVIKNAPPTKKYPICAEGEESIAYKCTKEISKQAVIFKKFSNFTSEKSVSFDYDGNIDVDIVQNNITVQKFHLRRMKSDILPELKKKNTFLIDSNDNHSLRLKLTLSFDKFGLLKMEAQVQYKVQSFYMYIPPKEKDNKMVFRYVANPNEKPVPLTEDEKNNLIKEIDSNKKLYNTEDERNKLKKIILSNKVNNSTKEEKKTKFISLADDESEEVFPKPMTSDEIKQSKATLENIWKSEKNLLKIQEKKNNLENFIYTKTEWIKNTNLNEKYAKKEELEVFKKDVEKLAGWFEKNGDSAKEDEINDKLKEARKAFKIFDERIEKEKKRDNSIKYFRSELNSAIKQSQRWISEKPWIEKHFNTTFEPKVNEMMKWIDEIEEKQSKIKEYEEPIFNKDEIVKKLEELREESKIMKAIPRPTIMEKDSENKEDKKDNITENKKNEDSKDEGNKGDL